MFDLTQLAQKPCVWLRYNPDSFKKNGHTVKLSAAKKQQELVRYIKHYQSQDVMDEWCTIKYLFYDEL